MKIGDKEFTPVYNNRSIYDMEDAFDKSFSKIMIDIDEQNLTQKQLGLFIWHGIKTEIEWEDFVDSIEPYQYEKAAGECGGALMNAFKVKKK